MISDDLTSIVRLPPRTASFSSPQLAKHIQLRDPSAVAFGYGGTR